MFSMVIQIEFAFRCILSSESALDTCSLCRNGSIDNEEESVGGGGHQNIRNFEIATYQ